MSKSGFAKDILKSFMERIERLEEEKAALAADIREVYAEAKGSGFDTKIMRKVIALRKLDSADFQEQQAILDLYLSAVGMSGTPLGAYAERQAPAPSAPAPKHPTTNYNLETGEITESHAKAGNEAEATETSVVAAVESVSRGADARSSAATSERMDATGGERPAPTPMELPAFLDRRTKKPAKVLEAAE